MTKYQPNKLRHFLIMFSAYMLGVSIVTLYILWNALEFPWGLFIGQAIGVAIGIGLSLRLNILNLSVSITPEAITGPSKWGWNRATISHTDIDWMRTRQLAWWQSPEGAWYIRSKAGQIILLSGAAFPPQQIREMLEKLKAFSQSANYSVTQ